jgi:hypothetical protein
VTGITTTHSSYGGTAAAAGVRTRPALLGRDQLLVVAALQAHEGGVRALLNDDPVAHRHDKVSARNCREAVCDNNRRSPRPHVRCEEFVEGRLHDCFGLRV